MVLIVPYVVHTTPLNLCIEDRAGDLCFKVDFTCASCRTSLYVCMCMHACALVYLLWRWSMAGTFHWEIEVEVVPVLNQLITVP
jgi:hypothetical protein